MIAQRLAKWVIVLQGNDGLWELIEVPPEDVGSIMDCVTSPVKAFAPSRWSVKGYLELFYPLLRARKAEYALDIGRYGRCKPLVVNAATRRLTLFLQKDTTFGYHDWHVAVYVAFAGLVEERYRNVRIGYASDEGYAKDAADLRFCVQPERVSDCM